MAKGLDIGTCFLVGASPTDASSMADVSTKTIRDAFLDVENVQTTKQMMKMSKIPFIEKGDTLYIVGDPALHLANMLKREVRRPLAKGVIAAGEREAEKILYVLLEEVVGKPSSPGEVCFYSIPAEPVDAHMNVTYHEAIFKKILTQIGYTAEPMNEAASLVYSNCAAEGFTALATSCLTPGQKVMTSRGFVNIEDIHKGDKVLTKGGQWKPASPTSRPYSGEVYLIEAYGAGKVEITADHLVWCGRSGTWDYVRADEVKEGDLVYQPWDNYDFSDRPYVCTDERITSSNTTKPRSLRLTDSLAELIGYFVGDGNLEKERGAIGWTLNNNQPEKIERVCSLIEEVFAKEASVYEHGPGASRVKMHSKSFLNWLNANCYSATKSKKLPWDVHSLNDHVLRNIIAGMTATDGNISKDSTTFAFTSTSPELAQFFYLACQRLGLTPSYNCRAPRDGGTVPDIENDTRVITGVKECFTITVNGRGATDYIRWLQTREKHSPKGCTHGAHVCKVSTVTSRGYEGPVYDLTVMEGDDHSFCVPGISIHNCGAGMVNTALVYQTMVGMKFSVARSGDWIDENAAIAVGGRSTQLMAIKEQGVNLLDPTEGDPKYEREREAIIIYYKNLIRYVMDQIKKEFRKTESAVQIAEPLPWILSGGTTKAKNFLELFIQEFAKVTDFPIPIKEIRMATDPLNDVAKGLLIAAMNYAE